jgi:S1-C subfamily serine protease
VENIPQEGGLSLQKIYELCIPSVVSISCTVPGGTSTGTGVVLTEDGFLVTNCHVVDGAKAIEVQFTDGNILDASLVGMDAVSDLAVLRVNATGLVPAQLGDSAVMRVGTTCSTPLFWIPVSMMSDV